MDIEYWATRWKEGRIGFHEGRTNTFLEKHAGRLGEKRRVLVPLCGKAEDMAFLAARGHEVVGVEAVEDAVRAFFAEHGLTPRVTDLRDGVRAYAAGGVRILAADLFACTKEDLGPVDALYDRAAIVALPPETRRRYVARLRELLPAGAPGLVVTFEYEQSRLEGPPFAVLEDELRALWADSRVEAIDEAPADGPRFREAGVTLKERCYALER
jgi:thiopurine S-methyltransferase